MALAKLKIHINSTVTNEGDKAPEITEQSAEGYMKYDRGSVTRISYKSVSDGAKTETVIEPIGALIRLVRSGAIESEMLFEVGRVHASVYKIPPFAFDMTVKTSKIESSLSPFGGTLVLEYTMTVGGAKKDCLMKITAMPV